MTQIPIDKTFMKHNVIYEHNFINYYKNIKNFYFYWIQYGEIIYEIKNFISKENYIIWITQKRN